MAAGRKPPGCQTIFCKEEITMLTNREIDIRDSFVLPYEGKYYLFGTAGKDAFTGSQRGFLGYWGTDLEHWNGPYCLFPNDGTSWATRNYWAPEVYHINGRFYLLGSWGIPEQSQTLCVLTADTPLGPYRILNDRLGRGNDPTLYCQDGVYYLIHNDHMGRDEEMFATRMKEDLSAFDEEPVRIFGRADPGITWAVGGPSEGPATFVTPTGKLLLLWSSFCRGRSKKFEAMGFHNMDYGVSISSPEHGELHDRYIHEDILLTKPNMGHCNLFRRFDGQLMLSTHYPDDDSNAFGCSNPIFFEIHYVEELDSLRIDPAQFENLPAD